MVNCSLWVENELLPQEMEIKYLGVLITSEVGAASSAVKQALYGVVMVKSELNQTAFCESIDLPTFKYNQQLSIVTERTRLQIQATENSELHHCFS